MILSLVGSHDSVLLAAFGICSWVKKLHSGVYTNTLLLLAATRV